MDNDCGFTRGEYWFRYRAAAIIVEEGHVLFAGNSTADYLYSIGGGVHLGERAEDAVKREVLEETGVAYEVDRLAVIHENFFLGEREGYPYAPCHEIAFYYLMKPRGSRQLNSHSYTQGVREEMHWIPVEDLHKYRAYPAFIKDFLTSCPKDVVHIVTDDILPKK